jgi:TolB-like protein/Flp pilus assembly protein TadD
MASESSSTAELELGHVLFMDIVGYSKLLIDEQSELTRQLNEIVRDTGQVQSAQAKGKLLRLPAGDGMALVFFTSPEAPMQCALEISRALKQHPEIKLRMGLHSGPVNPVSDVNERENVAGIGINIAKRVMDCGDAGHILLSKRVAEDLSQYARWCEHVHEIGQIEVKHGVKVEVASFYNNEAGNAELPDKFKQAAKASRAAAKRRRKQIVFGGVLLAAFATGVGLWTFFHRSSWRVASASDKSIAVLPFENLSDEKQNTYFADGVQDEILTDLARIADLKVISRTSVMPYKSGIARNLREIGQQLSVANVVEGTVQRSGKRVRVNVQLIDARTDKQLWGQVYDRDLADVFAIQSEIARNIADQLQAKLSPGEEKAIERSPTTDIAAFDLYTRARNILAATDPTDPQLLQAVDLLNEAIARDPSFLDAYCELAYAHDYIYNGYLDHTSGRLALAEAAIQAAARLRPDAGETHLARARNLYWGYWDYAGALAELEIARRTLPNDSRIPQMTAYIQNRQGQWEEATRNLEHAIELNPRDLDLREGVAMWYTHLRRYADLRSALASTLTVFPNDLNARIWPAYVEFQEKADTRPLHEMLDAIRTTNPAAMWDIADWWLACALAERDATAAKKALDAYSGDSIELGTEVLFNRSIVDGLIARMTRDEGKARLAFVAARAQQEKILGAQPNNSRELGLLGLIDAGLGRNEEALREGRRAVELARAEKDVGQEKFLVANLAMTAAWVGDKDLACEQLEIIIRRPGPLSYGGLKLWPWWDPLRGDPRFEKLLEEAKQPVALK